MRPSRLLAPAVLLLSLSLGLAAPASGQDDDGVAAVDPGRDPAFRGSRGLQRLARELAARDRALARRERTVAQREADILAAEEALASRMEGLSAVREELEALLDKLDEVEEERLSGLVTMTEKMREKQATAVFVELDEDLAVQVLDRMNPTKAGRALAAMPPDKAARLAEKLTRPISLSGGR